MIEVTKAEDGDYTMVRVPCPTSDCQCWGYARIAEMMDTGHQEYAIRRVGTKVGKDLSKEHQEGKHDRANMHQVPQTNKTQGKG